MKSSIGFIEGPQFANTTDGYLIFSRNATYPGGIGNAGYYRAANFVNLYGAFLRPPITVDLLAGGNTTEVMNWHADFGATAGWALEILDAYLGSATAYHDPVVVAGDFNVRGNFSSVFGQQQNFDQWTNIVATYPGPSAKTIWGLDHILTSGDSHPILAAQLNFKSDAYHFPIAAQF